MRLKRIPVFCALLVLCCTSFASAGPLRLFSSGGPESSFEELTFSESDLDLQRPATLLKYDRGRFTMSKEFESAINQTKNGNTEYLGTSRKTRIEFMYPLSKSEKHGSVYAFQKYSSATKFITDSKRVQDTYMYWRGTGSANAIARRFGPLGIGFFLNDSRITGAGASEEINQKIELLDPAELVSVAKDRKQGIHATLVINKRLSAGYLKSSENIRASINLSDADDDYRIPATIFGEQREVSLSYRFSPKTTFSYFYNRGTYDSFDSMSHNTSTEIGRWLSNAEYEMRSLYVRQVVSPRRTRVLGFEDYTGRYELAGVIDIFGTQANLLAGYFLFNSHGSLHRRTIKYAVEKSKGNYTYRFMYSYSTGRAFFHFDSSRRDFIFFTQTANENSDYDFKLHRLGFGIKKNIAKNAILQYSIIQVVPILEDKFEIPKAPSGQKKKTRGGTLQLLSIVFLL
jgi:hypothetical protein